MRDERSERERLYHNARFTEEVRTSQRKYYFALRNCHERYHELITRAAEGADVLEYGCAAGRWSVILAETAKSLLGIDISDVAVAAARDAARAAGRENTAFKVMNAERLDLPDGAYDFVFGSGILHHLNLDRAYAEVERVLRPGGKAIFMEPLGHNVAFNLYRALTPGARTADERPLLRADVEAARRRFRDATVEFYGLSTLASVPFRNSQVGDAIYGLTATFDEVLLKVPGLRWQSWFALLTLSK
jgi:SAM-dependent methyltransferase